MIDLARIIATKAHKGQKRWNGKPYITHPERVSLQVKKDEEKIVAWLHDVIEDTNINIVHLYVEFGSIIGDAVDAITKREGERYLDYILRVKSNELARVVKIADIKDNLQSLKKGSMKDKYEMAIYFLEN